MRSEVYGIMMAWCLISIGIVAFAMNNGIDSFILTIIFLIGYILIATIIAAISHNTRGKS